MTFIKDKSGLIYEDSLNFIFNDSSIFDSLVIIFFKTSGYNLTTLSRSSLVIETKIQWPLHKSHLRV